MSPTAKIALSGQERKGFGLGYPGLRTVDPRSLGASIIAPSGNRPRFKECFMDSCVRRQIVFCLTALLLLFAPALASAQGTRTDYERADSFDARTRGLVVEVVEGPSWIEETNRTWYRKTGDGVGADGLRVARTRRGAKCRQKCSKERIARIGLPICHLHEQAYMDDVAEDARRRVAIRARLDPGPLYDE